jgi:predicted nuclease with TOPRIM domain
MVGEYFDPCYPARVEGLRQGHIEGFGAGRSAGYEAGYADGRAQGWDDGVNRTNEELRKQMAFTRQHADRATTLAKQLQEHRGLIHKLLERLTEMEREQVQLKSELNQKAHQVSVLGADHVWQHNKAMMCLNVLRDTMDEAFKLEDAGESVLRTLFKRHYQVQIRKALNQGTIRVPIDQDEAFAKALPTTHRFLINVLRAR